MKMRWIEAYNILIPYSLLHLPEPHKLITDSYKGNFL